MTPEARAELVLVAEERICDVVRNEPLIAFHREDLSQHFDKTWGKSVIGKDQYLADADQRAIVQEAADRLNQRYPSMRATPKSFSNSDSFWGVEVSPCPECEWSDVLRELHAGTIGDPLRVLTYSGEQMLERVDSGEFTRGFVSELSVRQRIRHFGYHDLNAIQRELEVKRGVKVEIEKKLDPNAKRHRQLMKFRVVSRTEEPPPLCPAAPNPVFRYSGDAAGVHLAFKHFLQEQLIALNPADSAGLRLWAFDSWASYWRCFPDQGKDEGEYPNSLHDLLQGCVVHPDVSLGWRLGYHDYVWTVGCSSSRPWSEVLPEIQQAVVEPDVIERYGLSAEAANLLRWVRGLPKSALLLGCTPIVEEAIREKKVRLGDGWPSDNLPALIDLLCEEVTRQTPFDLRPVPWKSNYSGFQTRVRVTKASKPEPDIIKQVAVWLRTKGVERSDTEIQEVLDRLLL